MSHNAGFVADLCTDSGPTRQDPAIAGPPAAKVGRRRRKARAEEKEAAKAGIGVRRVQEDARTMEPSPRAARAPVRGWEARTSTEPSPASLPLAPQHSTSASSSSPCRSTPSRQGLHHRAQRRSPIRSARHERMCKSNLLAALANREVPVPPHVDGITRERRRSPAIARRLRLWWITPRGGAPAAPRDGDPLRVGAR